MVVVTGDDAQVIGPLERSSAEARVTAARLDDRLGWSERAAGRARLWFRGLKLVTGVFGVGWWCWRGVHALFQFHERWIGYRSPAEAFEREVTCIRRGPGGYHGEGRDRMLAGRVEELLSREGADWVGSEQAAGRMLGVPR